MNEMVALVRRHPKLASTPRPIAPGISATRGSGWEMLLQFGNTLIQDKVLIGLSARPRRQSTRPSSRNTWTCPSRTRQGKMALQQCRPHLRAWLGRETMTDQTQHVYVVQGAAERDYGDCRAACPTCCAHGATLYLHRQGGRGDRPRRAPTPSSSRDPRHARVIGAPREGSSGGAHGVRLRRDRRAHGRRSRDDRGERPRASGAQVGRHTLALPPRVEPQDRHPRPQASSRLLGRGRPRAWTGVARRTDRGIVGLGGTRKRLREHVAAFGPP